MILSNKTKCLTCPYKLGKVKCIVSPCRKCIDSGRKDNPFDANSEVVRKAKKRKK